MPRFYWIDPKSFFSVSRMRVRGLRDEQRVQALPKESRLPCQECGCEDRLPKTASHPWKVELQLFWQDGRISEKQRETLTNKIDPVLSAKQSEYHLNGLNTIWIPDSQLLDASEYQIFQSPVPKWLNHFKFRLKSPVKSSSRMVGNLRYLKGFVLAVCG